MCPELNIMNNTVNIYGQVQRYKYCRLLTKWVI